MRLATLNIGGPSVTRARALLEYLPTLGADVLALTETRPNEGTRLLLDGLGQQGWSVINPTICEVRERGVALAFREPSQLVACASGLKVSLGHRVAGATVATLPGGAIVLGVYVPSRDASIAKIERKQKFLEELVRVVREHADRPLLVLGDFNVVSRGHLPKYSAFRSWEYDLFDALADAGMVDAYAHLHPTAQAHSWIGRSGAGYQYDYAFVSSPMAASISRCVYDHGPRVARLTDHAAVVLSVDETERTSLRGARRACDDLLIA